MLIFLWISLILCVDGEECDHHCSLQTDKTIYPCSTIEKVTDCKSEYVIIEKGIKTQINFTSKSKLSDSFKDGFHFLLVDALKSTYFCYQISQSFVGKYFNQELTIDCKTDDVNKDIIKKRLIFTTQKKQHKREIDCEDNKLTGTFQVVKRILKMKLKEKCNGNYSVELYDSTGEFQMKLNITANESLYLKIPEKLKNLYWKLYYGIVRADSGSFNFSDPTLEGDFSETTTCLHTFPNKWNTTINLQGSRSTLSFFISASNIPCFEGNYIVRLFKVPSKDSNCESNSRKEVAYRTINMKSYNTDFKNCSDGNYCIRIRPIDDRCSSYYCPTLYSYQTVTISGTGIFTDPEVIKEDPLLVVWIIIPVSLLILLIAVLVALFCFRKRIFSNQRRFKMNETSCQLADKMNEIKMTSKQTILMLRCNENEKTNKDIDQFIMFLEDCCFCKVLHAKTVSAHNDILETTAMDWLADVIKKATKTIVIVTEKTCNLYNLKYKEVDDPNFCLFSDNTCALGIQKLKQCPELKRIFVRFCCGNDLSLSDLIDEVIEIPQAFVHLFHCIHNKKALICDETELIDYWMSNESFQYFYQLNRVKETSSALNHDNETHHNPIPSKQTTTNRYTCLNVDGIESKDEHWRKQPGLKLTNLQREQNRNLKEGYDNNAFSE